MQDTMAATYGDIGGWKIGAGSPTDTPVFAPMPGAWMVPSGSTLSGERFRLRGVEGEIAFQMGADLRPRDRAYTREEVIAAIGQCAPVIELLEAGLEDPLTAPRYVASADMQMHGGFVIGASVENWQAIDWSKESVQILVDGHVEVDRTASNTAGTDLLRLVLYLANEGSQRTNGLRKGQWITTGSWTGNTWLKPGQSAETRFKHAGSATVRFP